MATRGSSTVLPAIALVVGSVLLTLGCLEGLVFRFVFRAPDVPDVVLGDDAVLRYRAGQVGVWRVGDDVEAPFRINAQGWNSGHARYHALRTPGRTRIAVVGDSYVAAFQVAPDRSFAEVLERVLGRNQAEVYRFGMDGAPLSQYLYMLEHEVLAYAPDVVVLTLIHNDFIESFRRHPGRYTRSFMVLRLSGERVVEEIPPGRYHETWIDPLRRLALVRYFLYRRKLTYSPPVLALKAVLFGAPQAAAGGHVANVEAGEVERYRREIATAVEHVFARLAALGRRHGVRLVLLMDAVRSTITNPGTDDEGVGALNLLVAAHARRHDIELLDLEETFRADWSVARKPWSFASDGHWNARAHELVGRALARYLSAQAPAPRR